MAKDSLIDRIWAGKDAFSVSAKIDDVEVIKISSRNLLV